jgi:predicted nucleotidyltransferase
LKTVGDCLNSKNLAHVLFGAYRRRALAVLLLNPASSYYVRELARMADVPPGTLHRELRLLTDAGLLVREEVGNKVRYQANRACPVFEELAGLFRKTAGLPDILREALAPLAADIDLAFIFGSVAQGREHAGSDVDVLVIGAAPFFDVVQALASIHQQLGREVNPVVMQRDEFLQKYEQGERFVTRIMEEAKIFLIGAGDDLEKLVENRPTQGTSGQSG